MTDESPQMKPNFPCSEYPEIIERIKEKNNQAVLEGIEVFAKEFLSEEEAIQFEKARLKESKEHVEFDQNASVDHFGVVWEWVD